jgi:hypothetical protein
VYGTPPERGDETFKVTGANLEMALAEAFPTPALSQRRPWMAAPTTDYSLDEVSDETFRCLQSQGKRVEDVLGPYQFRMYNALLLKAVKAANSRCAGDDSVYNLSELQAFLDEVGVCHVTAPMAEYLARHFPRRDGGQKYYSGLEEYAADHSTGVQWAVSTHDLWDLARAEQGGQSRMNAGHQAAQQAGVFTRVGVHRVSAGARSTNADPVQFQADARSVIGQRLHWSNSLKKKVEDFFYRVKATSRGDGPRLVEVNFSRWAREDMVCVRCPLTISSASDGTDDLAEVKARHSASREEIAVDWAFRVRWRGGDNDLMSHYPEFDGDRESPFFTVASGRSSVARTLVRQLV